MTIITPSNIKMNLLYTTVYNTGFAKKCIHTLTKDNSMLYNRLL